MLTQPAPLLHCDWLQASIKWVSQSIGYYSPIYKVKKLDFSTRHFSLIEELYLRKKRIATITRKPCSPVLDPLLCIVKFDNWVLYDNLKHEIILGFFQHNGIELISISRIDFCCDFQVFDNGMKPETFIKKYVNRKLLREGKSPQVAHHFGQGLHEHLEKGLKFGTNNSPITAYIYNKTQEMKDKVWKPYIYQSWIDHGFDSLAIIWRIEFSVKSGGMLIIDTETGEVDIFLTLQVIADEYIYKCFFKLYERYFSFVWNDGQVRRSRMRRLNLFRFTPSPEILVPAEAMRDADRAMKIFLKKLNEFNDEMRGTDFHMNIYMQQFQRKLIEDARLQTWAMQHGLNL